MDPNRERFLRDRVLTATPAQRVVMLYDRLALDLTRARMETDQAHITRHVDHAFQIVTELLCSLDESVGGPAQNLAQIYTYMLRELVSAQLGEPDRLQTVEDMVGTLRIAWSAVADGTAEQRQAAVAPVVAIGSWTA